MIITENTNDRDHLVGDYVRAGFRNKIQLEAKWKKKMRRLVCNLERKTVAPSASTGTVFRYMFTWQIFDNV